MGISCMKIAYSGKKEEATTSCYMIVVDYLLFSIAYSVVLLKNTYIFEQEEASVQFQIYIPV